jgi:hypothetical protein
MIMRLSLTSGLLMGVARYEPEMTYIAVNAADDGA